MFFRLEAHCLKATSMSFNQLSAKGDINMNKKALTLICVSAAFLAADLSMPARGNQSVNKKIASVPIPFGPRFAIGPMSYPIYNIHAESDRQGRL